MSKPLSRQYKPNTRRRLDTLSGNQCYAPDCKKQLIAKDGLSIVSKICHIEAASAGGARFNRNSDDEDRRAFENLILLCDECHTIIDNKNNEHLYPVDKLKEWKKDHEEKQINKLVASSNYLTTAVKAIIDADLDEIIPLNTINANSFNISEKISHNDIKRNRYLIDEYKIFHSKLSVIYQELEDFGVFKKERLLQNIRTIYLKVKGKYVGASENPMSIIRNRADDIIEDVESDLLAMIGDGTIPHQEDLNVGITIIMIDAFMRCKILEEPPSHDSKP